MTPTFREITAADMDAIFAVRIATWHNDGGAQELIGLGITPESVRVMLQDTHAGWLCEIDSRVVGFAMGNRTTGEMWVIAVLPEHEGYGIGKRLLALVEEWLFEEGCEQLWLTTDLDESLRAVGFYRHLGWEDWKFEDGDRYMWKRIVSP